jgi:type IV pilus assembly protein PilE
MKPQRSGGFTLIELMVVVAIVAILAAIAIPAYTEQARKGRRADAVRAIGELQLNLERWRAENPSYAACSPAPCGSGTYPVPSTSDYYTIQFSNPTATTYTITAAPKSTSAQAGDRCGTYTFAYSAGVLTKSASGGANSICSL